MSKCLGCFHTIEDGLIFCSITCACLCGYFSVTNGWIKDPSKITKEERDKFLNNDPIREYEK
jgi:hypothetical protein